MIPTITKTTNTSGRQSSLGAEWNWKGYPVPVVDAYEGTGISFKESAGRALPPRSVPRRGGMIANTAPILLSLTIGVLSPHQEAEATIRPKTIEGVFAHPSDPEALAMQAEHFEYLDRVSAGEDPLISPNTAELARVAWSMLSQASRCRIPIPAACTGPDGQMLYAWDSGRHHLELEIFPCRPAEFFYKDRVTRDLWGANYEVGAPIPAEVIQKLKYFA